jgi:hypothetical protein
VERRLSIRLGDLKSGRILTIRMDHKPQESGKNDENSFYKKLGRKGEIPAAKAGKHRRFWEKELEYLSE